MEYQVTVKPSFDTAGMRSVSLTEDMFLSRLTEMLEKILADHRFNTGMTLDG